MQRCEASNCYSHLASSLRVKLTPVGGTVERSVGNPIGTVTDLHSIINLQWFFKIVKI